MAVHGPPEFREDERAAKIALWVIVALGALVALALAIVVVYAFGLGWALPPP